MRHVRWMLLTLIALVAGGGCSWSDFWSSVGYGVNGSGYRRGADNGEYDLSQKYDQQATAAQEYYQTHK
jgi:hypothetical protein